jgi:RNA polymerase sigma factor (sigma-70 family)
MNAMTALTTQAGDNQAEPFDRFYRRCYPGMVRFAYVITGSGPHVEELVQDSFTAVYPAYTRGDLREPEFYLKRTVVNRCRRWKGSQARRREYEVVTKLEPETFESAPDQATFEDTVENRDAVWAALDRLPSRQRIALALYFYEDMRFEQIEEVMREPGGEPLNLVTVRSWVFRGLANLKKEMQQ